MNVLSLFSTVLMSTANQDHVYVYHTSRNSAKNFHTELSFKGDRPQTISVNSCGVVTTHQVFCFAFFFLPPFSSATLLCLPCSLLQYILQVVCMKKNFIHII